VHKERNVLDHLPDALKLGTRRALRDAYNCPDAALAVAQFAHNVRRWRDGEMIVRWVATAVSDAEKKFRRLSGYKEMPLLIAALDAHADSLRLDTKKKVA
jgi:hypothetical protein